MNMRIITLFFLLVSSITFSQGPPEWFHQFGDDFTYNEGKKIAAGNGFVYSLQRLSESTDMNPGAGTNNFSGFEVLICYNQFGTYINGINLDTDFTVAEMNVDPNGNLYIAGHFTSIVTVGGTHYPSNGGRDAFVMKLDSGLNLQWFKRFGGSNDDYITDMIAGNNFVHLAGYFEQTVDFDPDSGTSFLTSNGGIDHYVSRLRSNDGGLEWAQNFGSAADESQWVRIRKNGTALYILGEFTDPFDADVSSGVAMLNTSATLQDNYIIQITTSNTYTRSTVFNGSITTGAKLEVDSEGGIYIFDNYRPITVNDNVVFSGAGAFDSMIIKFKASFLTNVIPFQWGRSFAAGDDEFLSDIGFDIDSNDHIHVGLHTTSSVDFTPGESGGYHGTTNVSDVNSTICNAVFTKNGDFVWSDSNQVNVYADDINDMVVSEDNDVYIIGSTHGDFYTTSVDHYDVILFKLGASSATDITTYSFATNINTTNHTVTTEFPYGTDLSNVSPFIEVSEGAVISPSSLETVDLTSAVNYTVTAADGTPQVWTVTATVDPGNVSFMPQVFLQSAWVNPQIADAWMSNDLVQAGVIPKVSPYSDAVSYPATNLVSSGINAVVDWVYVELRDATDPTIVIEGQSGLLRADGDIVDRDQIDPLTFTAPSGDYYVAIHHRNHLSIMSLNPIALDPEIQVLNFFDGTIPVHGTNVMTTSGSIPSGTLAMWAGDTNGDGSIKFSGDANDSNVIKGEILADVNNILGFLTYESLGYSYADVNLNGGAKFSGDGNDTNMIKSNVLSHPTNILGFLTFAITEQLP